MSQQLEEALVEALDLLEQGTPIVKILSRYPDLAGELRSYLTTALDLNHLAKSSSSTAREASRSEFLGYAAAMQVKQRKTAVTWLREILVTSLAVLVILFFAGAVTAISSSEAIPGDALYETKLFLEQIRLNYSPNSEEAAALIETFHQERLDEVNTLISLGRQEIVTFSGVVEELGEGLWIVEGIPVAITSSTIIHGEVEVGFLVQVKGKTSSNIVLAEQVEVMAGSPDSDLTDPIPQNEPSTTPLPTIEPIEIPERPELLLPEDSSESPSTLLEPVSTGVPEEDINGNEDAGNIDEGDRLESPIREDDDAQQEIEDGPNESSNDEQEDNDDWENEEDQSDDNDEDSDHNEEDKDKNDTDQENDAYDGQNKDGEVEGDKLDDAKDGKNNASNLEDHDKND
jgi:hypothetical protein